VLSANSLTKAGYIHKEIQFALQEADKKPEARIYLIPARLEECDVLDALKKWQWVDLFEEGGYTKLL
jgi:hypothetical protein